MAIPKPKHLKRYQQIAWLLVNHARSDLAQAAGLDEVAADSPAGREMAAEVPYFAPLAGGDLGEYGIQLS